MVSKDTVVHGRVYLTAITVMNSGVTHTLCPLFGKCDGIVVIDTEVEAYEFHPNPERTAASLCDLIVRQSPQRLVCGFVPGPERQKLRAKGIDIRLGTCNRSIHELTARFHELPEA